MKEEDFVVVSSDSEEDEDIVWMRKNQNKQYQILSEKIRPILYYQVQPGYKKSIRFPYDKFQEFANDFQKSLDLVNTESTKAFIWKNLIRWIVSIKLCYENTTDCINDRCYNLILTDLMAQYINYKCKLNSSISDEAEVSRVTNDIILTLNLVFSGWVPGILMTLLKIDVIDKYQLILYPIFRKYLSNKHLHETSDFISYLRLILCFRKWKKLTHLKEDKEIINEIAVGKSLKALNSDVIDLSTETVDMPVLPRTVPAVNEDNREFAKINGLIGFAMKHRETGTRILLISKTFELDDAIEQFFKQYSEYINRWTPKLLDVSKWEIKPTLIEDLTRSPSPSDQLRESSDIANKININGKQGTKAVDQHLSINCDTSSISVYNKLNNLSISSHNIENLSPSFKNNQQNRNSDAVLSSNNNNVIDLETEDDDEDDDDDDEDENKPMSAYEKQVFDVIEKLKKRAIVVGELLDRVNTEKTNNPPVILDISSDETRQSSGEVPAVPVPLVPVPSVPEPVPTARNNIEVPVATNSDPIRASLNPPNIPVEKHIRKRHGIVSSTTSFEGTGDDSDNSDDYDGFGVHSRVLFSQRSFSKVVEEATSSTNEIPKTHSNVNSQPRRSISSSPCPTRPSSASPDRWSNFSPSSTIRSGSSSRLGIVSGTSSLTAGRSTSSINDGEMPTCSRYVAIPVSAPTLPNKDNTSQKDHNIELNNKESAASINVIESSASTPKKSETEEQKSLPSHPTSDPDSPIEETPSINKLKDLEVYTRTCSVRELLKNISGFIGDSQEEYGFKSSKDKCGPDKSLIEISLTSTNVKNKSIGSASAEKTEANLSQIKVRKTLDGVEKDTNTRKEVENKVKALIPQQLKVLPKIDTINESKNSNTSSEIVEEENSRRFIEKADLEKSNDISCHPQLDIDKKSTKVKEVIHTENEKDSASTNVENKSIGSTNAEKTEANLSQIKVRKTLDGVEKDTNTRKEVENQVKALILQELEVLRKIDTINESNNSNTSSEIVEEENSRRFIEKSDLEKSNDISCHPQLDILKKSTKVKEVTNTENKKDSASTNVKNKSIGSTNAEKTEANLSQIKVRKTLDGVKKDTNTRKEVENKVKALIPQQLKVLPKIDTINESNNSNASSEIVEEKNSRRFIEKADLEESNDISCHPQLDIDKKSTKVKEVTNTEDKKVFDQPNELEKVESIFKISIKESENDIESIEDNSNTQTKEAVGELSKTHVDKSKSIIEQDNSFEEDESSTDDIESPPYEPICQNESLEMPDKSSETDNKETQTNKEQTSQPIENSSAENENGFGAQNVQKDCISNCQKGDQANKPTIVEQVSEPNRAEDIILTSQEAVIEKLSDNKVEQLSQNELIDQKETNAIPNLKPSDDGKLKIDEIVKSDHDYVTVDYLDCSNNDHAFDELKELQSFIDSPKSSDFETSTKDTSCSDQILEALNEDIEPIDRVTNDVTELQILENEEKKDYEQFFEVFTDPAFTSDNPEDQEDTITNQLIEDEEKSVLTELTILSSEDQNRTIEKQIIHDKQVNEEQFLGSKRYSSCDGNLIDKTAETLESLTSSSKENIEDQCVNRKSSLDTSLTLLESQLNSESTILHQEETGNQNIETVEKQCFLVKDIIEPESVLRKTSLGLPADIGFDVEGVTERGENAKPENLQKDKAIDDQTVVDDNDINENQSTAQKLSCDDNAKSIETELYTEDLVSSNGEDKENICEAKTKNAMGTPDVDTNDENQDLTEQTTSTEKQNSKSNEIGKDQLVIQESISNISVNLINRELIKKDKECEKLVEQTLENQSSNIEDVNKEKLGFVEEANEKKSDRNTHNNSPDMKEKSETDKKQTVHIQKVHKNDFYNEEISSCENVTQNKKETTEHSANQSEDNCTTEQNKIGEIISSSPRVVHSSLEVLTTTEDESTLYNKVIDDESFLKDNPEEKIPTMGETDSTESINKSQMVSNEIVTSPAEDKKKRKLIIRIARLSILEDELVRADSLSKIENLNEQKLEDLKFREESGEYQIKKHTSRKIQKQSRKKIKKALKKQALQEIILEKANELIVEPIKDSKTSTESQFLKIENENENELTTTEEHTHKDGDDKTKAGILSEEINECFVEDVKEVATEMYGKIKLDKKSTTKTKKTKKKELKKKKQSTEISKTIQDNQSSKLNASNLVDHKFEKENYENQSVSGDKIIAVVDNDLNGKLKSCEEQSVQNDEVIQTQLFDVIETSRDQSITTSISYDLNDSKIDQKTSLLIAQDENHKDNSHIAQKTMTLADFEDQDETTTGTDVLRKNTAIKPKDSFSNITVQEPSIKLGTLKNEYEYENTIGKINTEMCCSNSTKTISEVAKTTPCSSKVDNLELPNLEIVESSSLPLRDVDAVDLRRKNINTEEQQDVSETSSENIDERSLLRHLCKDETKRKLIIRIPKMLVSTDKLPKQNISGKKKSSKKESKANKVFSTLISKILEKEEVEEPLTDDDSIVSTKEQEFSESIDIRVKKEIITDEVDKHQTNERESNARLEGDEETRTKISSKMNKAKGSEIPQTNTLGKNMVESIPVLKLSTEQEIENRDISKTNVSNESLIEPIEIKDDLMICINKKLQKAKKKNKKTKKGAKTKAKKLKIAADELTVVKDSAFATNHDEDHISKDSECIITQSDHHQTDSEENINRVETVKPQPKAIVENVIGHESFVKAILEEYIKESSKNTAASSIEIPISKSVDNDELKLLKTPIEVSEKTNINNLQENTSETADLIANAIQLNKEIRETSTKELILKKKKTTIKANTSFESIDESTPSTEIQTLKVKEEKVEVDIASADSIIKNAECQTEPKSTIKTYIQPCSSKCSKFSDASSTKQLDLKNGQTNILKNIVELKDDLVKNRNQEVFSQITCAKQQNSMEPDSSSQLATELQRTENTLTEEESNLSTRVQVADLGEPSVISDSEISQQNASVALESDKSIVFYPSRDSAEDQEVSSITSKTNESGNTTYYNYNDENGTPVMDEKNTPEEDSPSSQCKIISLSKIRVPTAEVHEITALLLSQSKELHLKPLSDTIEPEAESHPICFEKVEECNANPEKSTTPSCDAPDENFELWLKKIGISKNCASSGKNVSLSPSKSIRYSSENQKNDRKQKRPQRVQKLEADPTDQKCFNFEDLNAAAILTSFKAQQTKKNTRSRKAFQPTRITRSASQMVDQAQAILLHDSESEEFIPSMSCPQSQCEKDPLENLELPRSNISSDSDDAGKLVIDLDTKKSTKSKANKKQKPKQIKKEKAPPKKNNKAVKKITFNPIVEVFEASSPDVFESRRTRTRSSRDLLTNSPIPISNKTKSTRGTPKPKKSVQNNTENDPFVDRVKISKTPIKKGKLRISFDESLGKAEQSTIINETNKESYPNISNYTPHNMNQETWLENLTLRKTSKSLDLEVKQILENVSMSRKVLSEPDLLKAPKIDITFLQTKPTVSENDLEDQNKTESKNTTFELDQISPIKVSPKIETLRTYKQLKGKNLNKCIRRLSMEDNAKEDKVKANKSISRKRTNTISDLIKPSKLQKSTKIIIKEPKLSKDSIASPVSFSETVKCDLITSTPKTTSALVLEQKNETIFTFTGTNIDKNGKDTKKSNVEKVETIEKVKTIANKINTSMEETSFNKVEKHYTSTSKEAKKSNKKANIKSSKQQKKPKILIKEPTPFEDSIEPVTPLIDTLSESVKSSVNNSIPELKQETQFLPLAEIKVEKEDVEENATVEEAASVAEIFPTKTDLAIVNEVEKQVKSITIKAKKSTKTRTYSIVDLKKSSKQTKTTKTLTKEPTLFEDPTAPTTKRSDSPFKTVELSITKSIHEVKINIDKNEKEQQDAKSKEATMEKSTSVSEVFNSTMEAEEQVKTTSKEANKSTKIRTYSIGDLKKSSKQEKKPKPLIEDPTPFEIPSAFKAPSSITIKSSFNNSPLEAETKINKNKNEKRNSDVKEVETIEQSEPIALLLSIAMEVDNEVKLNSKEANNSTKTVADIIKPSKELKKTKISIKEPTPLQDLTTENSELKTTALAITETKIDREDNEENKKSAKIEEMETNEQSEPMTQLLNTAMEAVSQVKLISKEDKNLSKTGISKIDESIQLEKTEPTHFEDPIAPTTLHSESPSETIKSALINPIHKTSENSDLKLNSTTLAFTETKADQKDIEEKQKNPNIEEVATTEQAESKTKEVFNTTMEVSCLNQVEEPVEPTSKVKCSKEQKDPETLIQEPSPFEDPIVPITPHNDSSCKTVSKSTLENPTKSDLDLECKKVASVGPIIDKKPDRANVEEVAIIEAAEPIAKAFSTEIDVKCLNEVRKQVKSISIEANNSTVTETCPIIPDETTTMPPRAIEQDTSFAEVFNTTMEEAEIEVNSTKPKIASHNITDLIKSDNTTATSSMVVTLNEEKSVRDKQDKSASSCDISLLSERDVNNLIDLPKAPKLSSPVDTPTKKEDVLQRKLDISILKILPGNGMAEEDTKQELDNSTAEPKDVNHLIKKSVETFPKLKRPFLDGVDVVVNDPVGRRRTSEVDGSELSFTNSLELDFSYVIDAENFADQSRQQPFSILSEPQQPLSEIMFSGIRGQDDEDKLGQDDEDKLHMFNTKLAFEPVPTSSPNENDDNLYALEEIYAYLPSSTLTNGPENVSGANSESAEKPKIDVKKSDLIQKEVDTLKASFEDGKTWEAGEKHTVNVRSSEYELNNTPTSISSPDEILMSPKIKPSRAHVIKLFHKTTPEKKVSTEESPESILVSKLKSRQKPFWKLSKTPTKPKVFEENSDSTKLNTSTSVISLADSPYTMDDVKSLPLNLDEIFEEKHTKTSLKTENQLTESNLIDVDSKKQVSNSLSPETDDLFDRLKNEAPVNKILKPVIEDSLSLKIENKPTINSSTHQINETKTQSLALVPSIPSTSLKLDEQKDKPNKTLPNKLNITDQRTLNSNNSNPLEKTTNRSCNELDETQKTCLESNTDKKSFNLKKIYENKKNSPQVNEIDVDLQKIVLKETANQSPISVVENSLLRKSTEITTENKTTSKHLASKTDATVEVVPSMPSSAALMVKATNSNPPSQKPINQCLETKIPDPSENSKTNQTTSEKNVVETTKSSLKKFSLSNNVQQRISSSEIPVTSTVVVVSSINPISKTPVKPESLVASGLSTTNKTPSSCKKVLDQSFVAKTIDPSEKINETQPVVAKKIATPSTLTLKRNSAFNVVTKGQEPPSKIFCTEILTKPVPVTIVSSMSAMPTSSVNQMILKPCAQKIPVKVIYPKKPIMQVPVSETRTAPCVKISEIHRTPENKQNVDESKSSLKRYSSLGDATKGHEPPSKMLRSENSTMSVSLQHQVSPSTLSQKSAPKIPYSNFTTSSPNVSIVKTPVRNETVTKSSVLQKNSTIQIASPSSQKLVESALKQSATFKSHSPKNSKTMTPVHTTEKSFSVAPPKTVTPIRTPGHTNYSDKPRPTPAPTSKSHIVQPGTTMSKPSNSGSRTLNALSADLKRVSVDVEKIKNDLGKLPEIDKNYIVHKRRKFLLEELDNKQKELNELKKKYQEYEKHTRVLKAHSERKPIDKDHPQHHHQHHNQQHRPNVSQSNDLKRKYDHSRPHSERQFSKPNTSGSGHSSHVERHKERNHTYVNKFSELDKINFANKNYQSADIKSESKKLPPWEPKQLTADEIIRTLRHK